MKPYIYYVTDKNTISADDIDKKNKSKTEIDFLKWSEELERIITKLLINIKYYNSLTWSFFTNIDSRDKYKNFYIIIVDNIVESIMLNYCKLFGCKDLFSFKKYLKYCKKNEKLIFKKENIININDCENYLSTAKDFYYDKMKTIRNKSYAHVGCIDMEYIYNKLDEINAKDIEKNILLMKNKLNEIWNMYCGVNLSFEIEKEDNIADIIKLIEKSCYSNEFM